MDAFEKQLNRIKEVTGCSTQSKLAQFFGTSQSSISFMIRKRSISATILLKLVETKGVNPDWIRTGRGIKYLKTATAEGIPHDAAKIILQESGLLAQIPSVFLIEELYKRSSEISLAHDARAAESLAE